MNTTLFKCLHAWHYSQKRNPEPKRNFICFLRSSSDYDNVSYLSIFRIGPNNYTLHFDSAKPENSWKHKDVTLREVNYAVDTWEEYKDGIHKDSFFEY